MGNPVTTLGLREVVEGLLCCTTSTLSALCSSCTTGYPRFIFSLFLLFGTLSSFLVLSPQMRSTLDKLPYFCTAITTEEMCDNLVGYGAVYRICFSLAIFYGAFSLLMLNTESTRDIRVKFHNGYWFLKLVLLVGILVGAFHIPRHTEFGRLLMYFGLTAGFIFIMIQILLVIDFAHSWSFAWAERIESGNSTFWSFALVFSTIIVYSMAITMAVFYYLYFTDLQNLSKCRGNMFLISFNVLHCLVASAISVLPRVQECAPGSGLLQSSVVSLYAMYLTWCTLSSEPDGSCNPMGDVILEYDKVSGVNGQAILDCVLMFALLIFACNVRANTSKLEKIGFSLSKYATATKVDYYGEKSTLSYRDRSDAEKYAGEENIDGEEYVQYNYSFFHFVMFLASLQLMMVVTNWHSPDELADLKKLVKNWATVWIQLSSSFLCVLFYIWATVTPLLVRTWGPCLGLDYECVPMEDDGERIRRRREVFQERREDSKPSKIETGATNIAEASSSKSFKDYFNSSRQKLGHLSLSMFKSQRGEQVTQDSGMCDVTNLTTHSRSTSRASERPTSSKSTKVDSRLSPTSEQGSESVFSNKTVYHEKSEGASQVELNAQKQHNEDLVNESQYSARNNVSSMPESACITSENITRCSDKEMSELGSRKSNTQAQEYPGPSRDSELHDSRHGKGIKTRTELENVDLNSRQDRKDLTLTLPRPKSAQLGNYAIFGNQERANTRPHSSMALTSKTFMKDARKGLTHNVSMNMEAATTRPKTCEPALSSHKSRFSQKRKEENEMPFGKGDATTKTSSSRNAASTVSQEGKNAQADNGPNSDLPCANETTTLTDNLNVSKSKKVATLHNTSGEARNKEMNRSQEILMGRDSKENKELLTALRTDNTPSEKSLRTPLKMQDHLKWVKSLRRTRGKVTALRTNDISERTALAEGETESSKPSHVSENEMKRTNRRSGCKQADLVNESLRNNQNPKANKERTMSHEDEENLEESLGKENRTKSKSGNELKNEQKTGGHGEIQTPDASKEILRLQEKILKFQAKVVKTQQKIFEMQQETDG